MLEARGREMRLGGAAATGQVSRGKRDSPNWVCQAPSFLPGAAQPQAQQSLTTFIISGKLRSGIQISLVKAWGFEEASSFLTKVSGVKHSAPGRAQLLGGVLGWEAGPVLQC